MKYFPLTSSHPYHSLSPSPPPPKQTYSHTHTHTFEHTIQQHPTRPHTGSPAAASTADDLKIHFSGPGRRQECRVQDCLKRSRATPSRYVRILWILYMCVYASMTGRCTALSCTVSYWSYSYTHA